MIDMISITLITMVASFVGTLSGFGVGTILTPVLLLFLPYAETIFLVGIIHWFHDIGKTFFFRGHVNWRLCLLFGIPSIVMSFLGAMLVVKGVRGLLPLIGIFIIAYALLLLVQPEFKVKASNMVALVGGGIAGFLAGLFGVRGVVKSAFLSAFNLPKGVYLATIGVISLFIDTTRVATYWFGGVALEPFLYWGALAFMPASFLGAYVGYKLVDKISHKQFRIVVALFMLLIGIKLLFLPTTGH